MTAASSHADAASELSDMEPPTTGGGGNDVASGSLLMTYRQVDLSSRDLSAIPVHYLEPSDAYSPTCVRSLLLHHNRLLTLPASMGRFTRLTTLDLSHNGLFDLPAAIGQLTALRVLSLANNHLEADSFPKSFSQLQSLDALNLGGNRIDSLPPCLFAMPKLRALYVGANRLHELPYDICKLKSLQILYLGGNRLTEIPATIGRLSHLTSLVLCDNRLETIPSTIADLESLESLSLHNNKLTTLPPEIVRLQRLHQLSLRSNPLVARFVREMTFDPPTLRELAGRVVKLESLPSDTIVPREVQTYLTSAQQCVNPKCRGVYFESCVEHVKFVDFCGKFRVPLLQYLCSPKCRRSPAYKHADASTTDAPSSGSDSDEDLFGAEQDAEKKMKKVLLG